MALSFCLTHASGLHFTSLCNQLRWSTATFQFHPSLALSLRTHQFIDLIYHIHTNYNNTKHSISFYIGHNRVTLTYALIKYEYTLLYFDEPLNEKSQVPHSANKTRTFFHSKRASSPSVQPFGSPTSSNPIA